MNKHKHLDYIQDVIKRLAGNSFLVKGWAVTLVSAIFVVLDASKEPQLIYVLFVPILSFWLLDGYFLQQERLYRSIYDRVRQIDEKNIDFSMKPSVDEISSNKLISSLFSITILIFYLGLAVLTVICAYAINIDLS